MCTDCGQGLGYVLAVSTCILCETVQNCLQCSPIQTSACSICISGYYVDSSSVCQPCPVGCSFCSSANTCTACAVNYTLPENYTEGQCLQCKSPCAACLGTDNYCLSCVNGFTKKGWKCQNNSYCSFNITLANNTEVILQDIDNITIGLLAAINESTANVEVITYNSISSGSTIVSGIATTSDPTTTANLLSASLSSKTLGNYTVISASVEVVGV